MLPRWLGDLIAWQGRVFLQERRWSFAAPFDRAELARRISSRIAVVPRRRLDRPWLDSRHSDRVRGLLDGDTLTLMPPRPGSLGNLFGLDMLFRFRGALLETPDGSEILGCYKVIPLLRWFLLLWLNGVMAGLVLVLGVLVWALAAGQADYAIRSLMIAFGPLLLTALAYLLGRVIERATRPSRQALFDFLGKLSAP